MREGLIKKAVACLLATCITAGVALPQSIAIGNAASEQKVYASIADIERDFRAAFQDENSNLSTTSKMVTDSNIAELTNYDAYQSGSYTSLADYLYSFDSAGALYRDQDAGTSKSAKNGFLYYDTKMENFTLEMEYQHNLVKMGYQTIYVGFGAQQVGATAFTDEHATHVRIQPTEMYVQHQDTSTGLSNTNGCKALKAKHEAAQTAEEPVWYTLKLEVNDGVATWWIDDYKFTQDLSEFNYEKGLLYIGAARENTAFRNIKITSLDKAEEWDGIYDSIEDIERDFKAAFQDESSNLSATSKIVTDSNIAELTNYAAYQSELYTSLADYLYSFDSAGALYRDQDAGTTKASKNGFLYYNTKMENFTLEMEYQHNLVKKGYQTIYVGFGAQEVGANGFTDEHATHIRIQPTEMYVQHQDTSTGLTNTEGCKALKAKHEAAQTAGEAVWYTFKLEVNDGVATWWIDDYQFTQDLSEFNYEKGLLYIGAARENTAFRNIKISSLDKEEEWDGIYDSIEDIERNFKAAFQDESANLSATSKMVTDSNIAELTNYATYKSGSYTSLADYLYSFDSSGAFYRDQDAGTTKSAKNGFLYYNTKVENFTLEMEYQHNLEKKGYQTIYIGFGAQQVGANSFTDEHATHIRIQPTEMYVEHQGTSTGLSNTAGCKALKAKHEAAQTAEEPVWYTFKLVVSNGVATWWIDDYKFTQDLSDFNYQKGLFYIGAARENTAFRNIKITTESYIKSMDVIDNITVPKGTATAVLPLPNTINASLLDETTCSLPIVWDTSNYHAATPGKYVLEGTIDVTGTDIPKNDINTKIQIIVTVANYDINAVREYDFVSAQQIDSTFQSYYVGSENKLSADSEIKSADASKTWTVTEKYGIKRSGTGDYSPSTSKNLAGSLLYFKEMYTEFEIEFDYDFNGTAAGYRWVGVGVGSQEYGKTGYHENGGTLTLLEREGHVRTFTNNKGKLITSTAFEGYQDTLSTKPHHLKLAVHNDTLFVYVDDYPVVTTALSNYNGGYIYLYGYTKDLEIYNLKVSKIATAELVQEIPYKSVQLGTNIDNIGLPSTLKVKVNGSTIDCPVLWTSENYEADKEGTYDFVATPTGKNSHLWLLENSKEVYASVTVGNTDEKVVQKFALNSIEELESYFKNYYSETKVELNEKGAWKPTYTGNTWKLADGILTRNGSGNYKGGSKGTFGVSALYYKDSMENFEIEFDYKHGSAGWRWVSVMFGQKKIGETYFNNGYLARVEREGKVNFTGSTGGESMNFADTFLDTRVMQGYEAKYEAVQKGESDEWFHYRLVVTNGVARLYINGELWSCTLAKDYNGGYIALSINSQNTQIKNLSITNYDAKKIVIASVESVSDQEIDKTKGDVLSLPEELLITDTDGYRYRMQVDWTNKDYRSGKLGAYRFIGTLIMPSKMVKNPRGIATATTVRVVKVDYNTKNTVKYYFDTEHDLQDFTDYYTEFAMEQDLKKSDWNDHWMIVDGQIQRRWDDFKTKESNVIYRKISRLTYNEKLTGNYQIDVDYRQDSSTKWWAMICFGTTDKTQFVVDYLGEKEYEKNPLGGSAIYLEREGYVNFWGNPTYANDGGVRLRVQEMKDKFAGYNHKEMHHMKITVIDGVARVYIDDYEATVAVRIPEEALGGYVSLMSNCNAATFDNFAITKLSDDAVDPYVTTSINAKDIDVRYEYEEKLDTDGLLGEPDITSNKIILPIVAALVLCGTLVIAFLVLRKKKENKQ